jgi:hypothetical protein
MKKILQYLSCIGLMMTIPHMLFAQYNLTQEFSGPWNTYAVRLKMSDRFAVIASPRDQFDENDTNPQAEAGSVRIMEKQLDGSWKFRQKVASSNRQPFAWFGESVAISGDFMAIGAPREQVDGVDTMGAVYIFHWNGAKWVEMSRLQGVRDAGESYFGRSLALDGNNLVIGSQLKLYGKPACGMAYLYSLEKGLWIRKEALTPKELDLHSNYGQKVAIHGQTAVIGDSDQDHLHVFRFNGYYWNEEAQVNVINKVQAVAIDKDYLLVGVEEERSGIPNLVILGAVQVFKRTGSMWVPHQKLTASDRSSARTDSDGPKFGYALDVVNGFAVVGAPFEDHDASAENPIQVAGAAYIFKLEVDTWREHQKIVSNDRWFNKQFGASVATAGGVVFASTVWSTASIYVYNKASFPSSSCAITKVRIFPKIGCSTCLVGGQVQVSNVGPDGPWTTIHVIPSQTAGVWNEYMIPSSPADYKAIRYVGSYLSHCGVAEIEFYKGATKLAGTLFHDGGGAWEAGSWDYTKAFDGKTDTYYYGRKLSGYVGIEVSCEDDEIGAPEDEVTEIVFPNPVTGARPIQIKSNRKVDIQAINIYDRNGKLKITSETPTEINVSALSPGIYSLHVIYSDGKMGNHQLIKR